MTTVKNIDRATKTISVSKDFLMKAGKFGTPEFTEMMDLRSKYAGYRIVEYTIARNPDKPTYGKLTYEAMGAFIMAHETDMKKRQEKWEEFQYVRKIAMTFKKGAYTSVKKWFLDQYKDFFDAEEKAAKDKADREKMDKYLLTSEDLKMPEING